MSRILAIEADARRRRVLTALVREHVKAELVVVASVQAALTSMAERTPDLIIAPTLLSPPDEAELLTYVKQLRSAPYVQMVTVPALDMLVEPTATPDEPPQLLPDLQSPADVARTAVRPRHGCGTDCRRSRSLARDANRVRGDAGVSRGCRAGKPTALVPCPRLVPDLSNNRSDFRRDEAADERRIALTQGPRRRALVVRRQGRVGSGAGADQHLEHRVARRDRLEVHARQHDRAAPVGSRHQPHRARALHSQRRRPHRRARRALSRRRGVCAGGGLAGPRRETARL